MTGENRIVAFGSGSSEPTDDAAQAERQGDKELLLTDSVVEEDDASSEPEPGDGWSVSSWLAPVLAGMSALVWTGFYGWANWAQVSHGSSATGWADLVIGWSVPMMLIGIGWLIVMRNSRREALRFGNAARLLADEAQSLEARLLTVNRELSLAREFIAAQSRDLESLGRIATDRLSHNAGRLEELIRDNGERIDSIGTVSEAALENMEKLRGQLPVIASSAKDVTNNIANAGRTAHAQLEEMVSGFKRLNEFGQASGRAVQDLREQSGETIAEFQRHCAQMEEIATTRFAALNRQGEDFRTRLDMQEVESLAAIRSRAAALGEELEEARALMASDEEDRLSTLRVRLATLRDEGGEITRSLHESERRSFDDWQSGLAQFDASRAQMFAEIEEAQERITESAQVRLASVAGEAERIETRLAESSRNIAQEIERIHMDAESSNSRWIASLSERLDSISAQISGRGRELNEELAEQHAELRSRHEQAIADLSDRCARLDADLSDRAIAILSELDQHHGKIGTRHADLLDDLSQRFETLEADAVERSERITREIEARRSETSASEEQAVARLRELLGAMDKEIAVRLTTHEEHGTAIAQTAAKVTAQLDENGERLAVIAAKSDEAQQGISKGLQAITNGVFHAQSLLGRAEKEIGGLTDASVRLLELIQASSKHSSTELPAAIDLSEQRLSELSANIAGISEVLDAASSKGDALSERIVASEGTMQTLVDQAEGLNQALRDGNSDHEKAFASLLGSLGELDRKSRELGERTQSELAEALDSLAQAARKAVSSISEDGASSISDLAGKLGTESAEAIDRAIHKISAEASGKLEQAAAHASGVSREATMQLRDQLAVVNELVGNLEQRVSQARARAEEQVDNDFARRVALITESLNSNAIDIAKALSTEVTDTAWAAYLRGDRGIFTRRAVSLLDSAEARAIQQTYERDQDFREHVSRYIHDFEAILRQVLSTRDGNALGVTLLSSDMGKLYVALAQGIERLRE